MSIYNRNELQEFVKQQTHSLTNLWFECSDEIPFLPPAISMAKKLENEARLSTTLDWVSKQLESAVHRGFDKESFAAEASERLKEVGILIFGLQQNQVNCIERLGINRTAEAFFKQAREFDPFISFEDIFQASRNVWTSNYLQVLLGLPVELTPSLFAYSMLYPVTDNYLDDPRRSQADKAGYNQRFGQWLNGETAAPQSWNEDDVLDLVRMVEKQYPRDQFGQVYESLLAIHYAQSKSARMPKWPERLHIRKVAEMSFEKGGTSVLADGFLAAGELSAEEMEIIFNYGAFAQLMDDQEDIEQDLRHRELTMFTEAARRGKADGTMNRVFNFAHHILRGLDRFTNPDAAPLKQMSMKGIDLLLMDAVLRTEKYYSKAYLRKLEERFPFRFEYLKRVRKTIRQKGISAERLIGLMSNKSSSIPVGYNLPEMATAARLPAMLVK
ncbi:MAG: hypothetical protein C0410_08950 [Anaerolinea sp.]|nr:hypothetical protein [Anaerolinea sp.]